MANRAAFRSASTVQQANVGEASVQSAEASPTTVVAGGADGSIYFRISCPTANIIDAAGVKHRMGDPVPYWFVTKDPVLAQFIRDGYMHPGCPMQVEELDSFTYQVANTIEPDFTPLPDVAAAISSFTNGATNSLTIPATK